MTSDVAVPLMVLTVGAMLTPRLGVAIGIPVAVVEIVFGVVAGRLGLMHDGPDGYLAFLADLGFALFLLLAGMETDLGPLGQDRRRQLTIPASALASFGLALAWGWARGWPPWIALAAGATSVPLMMAVIRELGLTRAPLGAQMLTAGAVGEIVTVALVSVAELVHHAHSVTDGVVGAVRLLAFAGALLVGAAIVRLVWWWYPRRLSEIITGGDASELGVRIGFGLMFLMMALATLAGVEPVLGAFFAGLLVGRVVRSEHGLEGKLGAMAYGFFVPVFFIQVGARLDLDLDLLLRRGGFILEITAMMFVIKLLPQLPGVLAGSRVRDTIAAGSLLAAPLTLLIAVADLGARSGAIDEATRTSLVIAGMLASLLYPSLAKRILAAGHGR